MRPGWIKNRYEICKVIHIKWQQQKELLFNYFSSCAYTHLRQKPKAEVFSFEFITCFRLGLTQNRKILQGFTMKVSIHGFPSYP